MDKVSDEALKDLLDFYSPYSIKLKSALTELRDRRQAEKTVFQYCPICGGGHNIGNPCRKKSKY